MTVEVWAPDLPQVVVPSSTDRQLDPRSGQHQSSMKVTGEAVTMPKRYRVEMTLVEDEDDIQLDSDTHSEIYDDEAEARRGFRDKADAAHEKGKGKGHG
jgi:hypothetical protein